jgi:hypothetical protein
MNELYKCNIDQKFLIDFLDLKSKKRESKCYVSFMEGAVLILERVCQNELLNINPTLLQVPNYYQEALN